jgi:8-oxo-dGTP pyrophosphatase MutT (NUDIX family)
MVWKPHVTVAAIAEREGRFLVVEEEVRGVNVFNNPAGHLEPGESFLDAVRREALEETGWDFTPDAVTGIYLWKNPELEASFVRVAFHGHCNRHHPERALDKGIVAAHWLTRAELAREPARLRSPMVLHCIDDCMAGRRYPLELLSHITDPHSVLEDA